MSARLSSSVLALSRPFRFNPNGRLGLGLGLYGVTYLKIVVETPLFVVLRLVVKRPLGMLPWST